MDDFGIPDFIAMPSHATHLYPSKMAEIMAAIVLSAEVLAHQSVPRVQYRPGLDKTLGLMWKCAMIYCCITTLLLQEFINFL